MVITLFILVLAIVVLVFVDPLHTWTGTLWLIGAASLYDTHCSSLHP